MSEHDKKVLETIFKALPQMDDFQKGYFLGVAETMARKKKVTQGGGT